MITYTVGGSELLRLVEPLWLQLNAHHQAHSTHFPEAYARNTFAKREASFRAKAERGALRVELATCDETKQPIGYCVASIQGIAGEIDSLYVQPEYRGDRVGHHLMESALAWMDAQGVKEKKLVVSVGNEQVLGFYARFGFLPESITLRQP